MDVPYTALARRFRPQTFAEVVGQGRIATTLRNAILEGRAAHAYLFTGARGVGKTSMARIFAKALNCPDAIDAVPCNQCEICRGIAAGQDVDVSEIDGASNRGIDDIRTLRANVNVRSMRSKYKIYIVDEVHMLTRDAFNALLKTLEEPPPGVKFIFCTTEPNKVPDTILSRCQRFDFGTIATEEIVGRLSELATAEGFVVEHAALQLVARRAAGSMRDSQSLFDQLLAFGSRELTAADVHRLLGTAPDDRLIDLVDSLIQRQPERALTLLDSALMTGVQLEPLWDQLIAYFRDLMVLAAGADQVSLMSVGEDVRPQLSAQVSQIRLLTVMAAMDLLAEAKQRMQRSAFGRAFAELALARIAVLKDLDRLGELITRLKEVPSPPDAARDPAAAGSLSTARPRMTPTPEVEKKNDLSRPSEGATTELPSGQSVTARTPSDPPPEQAAPPPGVAATTSRAKPEIDADESKLVDGREIAGVEVVATSIEPRTHDDLSTELDPVEMLPTIGAESGPQILEALRSDMTDSVGTTLKLVHSAAIIGPNTLEFVFPISYDFARRMCERPEVVMQLESRLKSLTGQALRLRFRTVAVPTAPEPEIQRVPTPVGRSATATDEADPFVDAVGRIMGVERWARRELGPAATETDGQNEA